MSYYQNEGVRTYNYHYHTTSEHRRDEDGVKVTELIQPGVVVYHAEGNGWQVMGVFDFDQVWGGIYSGQYHKRMQVSYSVGYPNLQEGESERLRLYREKVAKMREQFIAKYPEDYYQEKPRK